MIGRVTRRLLLPSLAWLFLSALPPDTIASSVRPLSSIDLQIRSDLIGVGRVESLRSLWAARGLIVTEVTVVLERTVKGKPVSRTILVRVPGGQVGETIQDIDGAPTFKLGQECLLFLKQNPAGFYSVMGLWQGKINLVREAGGRLRMERLEDGALITGLLKTKTPGSRWTYLEEFLAQPEVRF
jgi:hypothetical protein